MVTQINHGSEPWVSVQIMSHSGDVHLLPRALASIYSQDLDPSGIEIQIVFDGPLSEGEEGVIEEATKHAPCPVTLLASEEKNGYYCVPRNRCLPHLRGFYIAHMDADNEMAPAHLSGLLAAARAPDGARGWPHFTYSRRLYVKDEGAPAGVPEGPSPLVEWTPENIQRLSEATTNFIDTGDLLVAKSVLYWLAEKTGCVWNTQRRRFGDHDLVKRMAEIGLRGRAVDQITNIYHWHSGNLQHTRASSDIVALPVNLLLRGAAEGKVVF